MANPQYFVNKKDMTFRFKLEDGEEGDFAVISQESDLHQFKKADILQMLANFQNGKKDPLYKKKTLKELAEMCHSLVQDRSGKQNRNEAKGGSKNRQKPGGRGPRANSKMSQIRELLTKNKSLTKEDLAKAIGSDVGNTHTMVIILKNPKRTKDPFYTTYDRDTQTYTYHATEDAFNKAQEAQKDKAAKAKADREAKAKADKEAKAASAQGGENSASKKSGASATKKPPASSKGKKSGNKKKK